MSGVYNNWFKVQHPNSSNEITPMESGGNQTPFFFGGSQVPTNLGIYDTNLNLTGKGLREYNKSTFMPDIKGKGIQSSKFSKHTNIHLPRHMGSLKRPL